MRALLEGLQINEAQRAAAPGRPRRRGGCPWRSLVLGLGLVGLLGGGTWRYAATRAVPVEVVGVAAPTAGDVPAPILTAAGYVKAARIVYVVPRVAGRITSLSVKEGDLVRAGDLIAELDRRDLEQEVNEARAAHDLAVATLSRLRAGARPEEVAERRAQTLAVALAEERAARELARTRTLFASGALPVQALEQATTDQRIAAQQLEAARQALAVLQRGARREDLRVAAASRDTALARWTRATNRRADARVQAPVAGRVLRKLKDVGDFVSPEVPFLEGAETVAVGSPIVALADPGPQEVAADINETDIAKIALEQPVEVSPNAYPDETLRGRVTLIAPRADRNKSTIQVKATLFEAARPLPHDSSVKLRFVGRPAAARAPATGVQLPARAVIERDGGRFVMLATDARAVRRAVEVGGRADGLVVVTSGLAAGDRVIVSHPDVLGDGQRIRLK